MGDSKIMTRPTWPSQVLRYGLATWLTVLLASVAFAQPAEPAKDEATAAGRIEAAAQRLAKKQTYLLRYEFEPGQQLRWHHDHVVTTKNSIANITSETSTRAQSDFRWDVERIDDVGQATFSVTMEAVNMWSKNGEEDPIVYDSSSDAPVPDSYIDMSRRIGQPLAVYTVNETGQIADKKSNYNKIEIGGIGDTPTFPLPTDRVRVGHKWNMPDSLRAKNEHGIEKLLKTRVHYELTKVKSRKAYISFKTEVLTPLESAKVKSQILWHLASGYIVFDLDRGMPVRREIQWDEKVQGYEGPDSLLKYSARRTEKLIDGTPAIASAEKTPATGEAKNVPASATSTALRPNP